MNFVSAEQEAFAAALHCDTPAKRDACLDACCGNDANFRRRVEALLEAAAKAGDFLEKPPTGLGGDTSDSSAFEPGEKPGDRIGRYKLLEEIGEGGGGIVYMAEQQEPVRRTVALKILKPGMDTRSVVARFEAERQALALMDHPNIARVFDGGATSAGRPFFVMELVRGTSITEYADAARLTVGERLALFAKVCHAIQHAHQKGIIHRDLKPSNVLVTVNDGVAVPRVIDFGIAKATGERLTDKSLFTRFHAFIGTPAYTSPEQAEMSSVNVDTRSDIYSLGVLLYELLTGHTPFEGEQLLSAGLDEMRRIIRDDLPARPSNRVSTLGVAEANALGKKRKASVPELTTDLRGDLDWIVMKCLEKDRGRRYPTAQHLASDVERHLAHEPVQARPPSTFYRMGKLLRRNKRAFVAFTAVISALAAGAAASLWQADRAQRGESLAQAALSDLKASAPAFAAQAQGLAEKGRFAEAVAKLDHAIGVSPESAEYLVAKGNLLECQMQFAGAAIQYRAGLGIDPGTGVAATHLALCEELVARESNRDVKWYAVLGEVVALMATEQRSDAETGRISAVLLDEAGRRLEAIKVLEGYQPARNLTVVYGGLLAVNLAETPVSDLRSLAGLPWGMVDLCYSKVRAISPFASLPLQTLNLAGTEVSDFETLRSLENLRDLALDATGIADLAPLSDLPLWWLSLNGTRVSELTPLQGLSLRVLRIENTAVEDLRPLAGMPLQELYCPGIPATDFSPLAACVELKDVDLSSTRFENLEPLRHLKLRTLNIENTAVSRVTPLAGMPLQYLNLRGSMVSDLTPLSHCPALVEITIPADARNVDALRSLRLLRRISYERDSDGRPSRTAEEFWKEWEMRTKHRRE